MRIRFFLVVLALLCAQPALGANTVSWTDAFSGVASSLIPGGCVHVRFTTTNETAESVMLYVGGMSVTIAADGDAAGSGASSSAVHSCTSPDGNRDGTQDTTACAAQDLVPGGSNILNGVTARGTVTPLTIPGWLYVDPDDSTIDSNEVHEVIVCAVL